LEKEGTAVEFLGRTKIRTKNAIVTVPDAKHRKAIIAAARITAKDCSEVSSKQLDLIFRPVRQFPIHLNVDFSRRGVRGDGGGLWPTKTAPHPVQT